MSEGLDRRRLLAGIGTAGAAAGIASARAADGEAILFSTVPDLGALSALTPMTGTVAWVAGCREAGDGGEGFFIWREGDSSAADGGIVVLAGARPDGRWRRLLDEGSISVRHFGARGDGVANDRGAFQAALDAARDRGGGRVVVPPGTYVCGDAEPGNHQPLLTIHSDTELVMSANARLVHNSYWGARLLANTAARRWAETGEIVRDTNIVIRGGTITYGRSLGTQKGGLNLYFVDNLTVDGLRFEGDSDDNWNTGIRDVRFANLSNLTIRAGGEIHEDGLHFTGNCQHVNVVNCLVESGDDALALTLTDDSEVMAHINIANSVFISRQHQAGKIQIRPGVKFSVIENVTIANCQFIQGEGGLEQGNGLQIENLAPTSGSQIRRVNVTNCLVDHAHGAGSALVAADVSDLRFANCEFRNLRGPGLRIERSPRVSLVQCQVRDWVRPTDDLDGVLISDSDDFVMQGCVVQGPPAAGVRVAAADTGPVARVSLVANHFLDCGEEPVLMSGVVDSIVVANLVGRSDGDAKPIDTVVGALLALNVPETEADGRGMVTIPEGRTWVDVVLPPQRPGVDAEVWVMPASDLGRARRWWVSREAAARYRVQVDRDPGSVGASFIYRVLTFR